MDGLTMEPRTAPDAARRLRAYFRGFGFDDPAILDRLVERILTDFDPSVSAETAASHARQRVEHWFVAVLGPDFATAGAVETIGRAAFLLSDAARRWPQHFLSPGEPPAEMVEALRRAAPAATPHAMIAMPEQTLAVAWSFNPARLLPRRPARKAPQS